VSLLDAVRALSDLAPPRELPPADLAELADVLEAHGLAALASYHLETRPIGAGLPAQFREKLLTLYQGVVNDNVFKVMTLRPVLREAEVPVVVLGGLAAVDWLYPHLAFRPLGDLRLAVRGEDGTRFAAAAARHAFLPAGTSEGGRVATFGDGRIAFTLQEGLWPGAEADRALFAAAVPLPAFGPTVSRPCADDMLLSTVAEQALLGLQAPLLSFVDLRELLRLPAGEGPAPERVAPRARALGLARALHGSMALLAWFFPVVAAAAAALSPELSAPERVAVDAVVEAARDPARLVRLRGAEAAARLVVAPR
jgi:hypothetical protein